jgi:hypothetical protein
MNRLLSCAVFLGIAACNPVLDDEISALGSDAPGVRNGPLHRPGQPCMLCHDGAFGDPQAFSIAGTVFQVPSSLEPSVGADVAITDSTPTTRVVMTNAAGNFYIQANDWTPVFPLQVVVRPSGGTPVYMLSQIEGSADVLGGACATCHKDPAGPDSPGHISVKLDDGGVPR